MAKLQRSGCMLGMKTVKLSGRNQKSLSSKKILHSSQEALYDDGLEPDVRAIQLNQVEREMRDGFHPNPSFEFSLSLDDKREGFKS